MNNLSPQARTRSRNFASLVRSMIRGRDHRVVAPWIGNVVIEFTTQPTDCPPSVYFVGNASSSSAHVDFTTNRSMERLGPLASGVSLDHYLQHGELQPKLYHKRADDQRIQTIDCCIVQLHERSVEFDPILIRNRRRPVSFERSVRLRQKLDTVGKLIDLELDVQVVQGCAIPFNLAGSDKTEAALLATPKVNPERLTVMSRRFPAELKINILHILRNMPCHCARPTRDYAKLEHKLRGSTQVSEDDISSKADSSLQGFPLRFRRQPWRRFRCCIDQCAPNDWRRTDERALPAAPECPSESQTCGAVRSEATERWSAGGSYLRRATPVPACESERPFQPSERQFSESRQLVVRLIPDGLGGLS